MPAKRSKSQSRPPRTSLLADLLEAQPQVRPQVYFKSSLVALSHALEDLVLSEQGDALVLASFQQERYYRQEASRYDRISAIARQVYVLAVPDTQFHAKEVPYERVALDRDDPLTNEWHVVIVDRSFATCLVCVEKPIESAMDAVRQFEGFWTFDREIAIEAAQLLLAKVEVYRPDLSESIAATQAELRGLKSGLSAADRHPQDPFSQRLMMYLQAGQYKLQRAYKAIQKKEQRERLLNRIVTAIRRSLEVKDIFNVAVQELGQGLGSCRCLLYRCSEERDEVEIESEFTQPGISALLGHLWPVRNNPLLSNALQQGEAVQSEARSERLPPRLRDLWKTWQIREWLAVPVLYQGRLLGAIELHRCEDGNRGGPSQSAWPETEVELVKAVAVQIGVALIQAEAYENLNDLNQQLEELDRAKSDLIAVTGHELRTPLSTIQVCLESLASEPEMEPEIRQVMLDTAIQDAERLRRLVQDFLTLSRLESGRVEWHIELLPPQECIDLALSSIARLENSPQIQLNVPDELPLVVADGEWLVEVLRQLLENACKFTPSDGRIEVSASLAGDRVQFTVADTGRGIEGDRLQQIFERLYQAERSLRRTVGGVGVGLAISRQIVESMGGRIWAESDGADRGSRFHFTIPISSNSAG
ncbi:DICT sensory domain-containing protein [Synechococcus sp. PCC 7336]|uniref:DICT sensory domain-containing protein n=1 Tax=Synechococcus sp. PCC 7336 TaxID=195250 RepID=UPI0003466244|nr:DICT sensory domain-containing protein [Synechococcus sp. PCC 7336]